MANVLEYAKVFNSNLDKLIVQTAKTSWMEANASQVKYNGGDEFKLANIVLDGLKDYDRADGFASGAVTLDWQTKQFKYDRGLRFRLDEMEVDETNFVIDAGTVLGEFVRTKAAPEVDMVRIAELAGFGTELVANALGDLETFKDAIVKIRDAGYEGQLVAHVTYDFLRKLEASAPFGLGQITVDEIVFPALEDVALIPTVSTNMVTAIEKDAVTEEIKKDVAADDLAFIMTGKDVPLGIVKHNISKIVLPKDNQLADAYDIHYRNYHTLEVADNKKDIIFYALAV